MIFKWCRYPPFFHLRVGIKSAISNFRYNILYLLYKFNIIKLHYRNVSEGEDTSMDDYVLDEKICAGDFTFNLKCQVSERNRLVEKWFYFRDENKPLHVFDNRGFDNVYLGLWYTITNLSFLDPFTGYMCKVDDEATSVVILNSYLSHYPGFIGELKDDEVKIDLSPIRSLGLLETLYSPTDGYKDKDPRMLKDIAELDMFAKDTFKDKVSKISLKSLIQTRR